MSTPTPIKEALSFIESDLKANLIPVIIGALQILEKNQSVAGVLAAKAYLLGNAPSALLAAEQAAVTTGFSELTAFLQAQIAGAVPSAPTVVTVKT